MLENSFQAKLIKEIKELFPGCVILKNDANYIQGFPDLTILYGKYWAVLESKKGQNAKRQPNQLYYVDTLNGMSYSTFISPENKDIVLNDLKKVFNVKQN